MPKNIVILLDGTSNEISERRTNILRLYGALEKGKRQLVFYDPGVGTFGAEDSWLRFWRKAVEIWGLATGWGLDHNVKEAYRFLVENYETVPGKDGTKRDSIYIFGFSRGAYTARVLAGFIRAVGLIERRNLNLLDYVYRAYKRIGEDVRKDSDESDDDDEKRNRAFAEVRLYERTLRPDRPPIRLLGLFDTVASVIEHGRRGPRLRSHAFTRTNVIVESVRHAVAIDERRTMFRPQLWPADSAMYQDNLFDRTTATPQEVREVWFTGVHADVGGGYPEGESQLAKIPLDWMIETTRSTGLRYNNETIKRIVLGADPDKPKYVAPDGNARRHESMSWAWRILELVPRRSKTGDWSIPLGRRRTIPEGAHIHSSVAARIKSRGKTPPNLPETYEVEA